MDKYTLVKGKIWNGESNPRFEEAFLVRNDMIIEVGSYEYLKKMIPAGCQFELVDAGSNVVMPGMTDAHTHLLAYAKLNLYTNLQPAKSFQDAVDMLHARQAELPKGAWIRGVNYNEVPWGISQITRHDLDKYFPDNPVLLSRYCGHVHVANTIAMKAGGVFDIEHPDIPRDAEGSVLGILNESAASPLIDAIASVYETDQEIRKLLREACLSLSAVGITAIHDCDAPKYALGTDLRILQSLKDAGELPIRIITYHDSIPNYNFTSGFGDEMMMFGGFKIFTDGSVGGRTAALSSPYSDDGSTCGQLNHTNDELYGMIVPLHKKGMQVQIHAIGDVAISQVADVLGRIISEYGQPALRYRLNHGTLTTPELVEILKKLGVAFDIQPSQAHRNRYMMPIRFGAERSKNSFCFRRFWETGLPVNSSSDAPIETVNPWWGIWTLCTRSDTDKTPLKCYDMGQILPLQEAIKTYTLNPWTTLGKDGMYGKIASGYKADFTVVEGDPFNMSPDDLRKVKHIMTYCNGNKVWSK